MLKVLISKERGLEAHIMDIKSSCPTQRINVFFVVSRDWQVSRSERIIDILEELELSCRYLYISEERWTLGNASIEARNQNREVFVLPRKKYEEIPIWLASSSNKYSEEEFLEFDSNLQDLLGSNIQCQRFLVFIDGQGPEIDGVPSQILARWLSRFETRYVFLQHGFRAYGAGTYLLSFKHGLHRLKQQTWAYFSQEDYESSNKKRGKYLTFVFDFSSLLHALLHGANPCKCRIVGNVNFLAFALPKPILPQNKFQASNRIEGTIIFTTGSYKNANTRQSQQFEMFVRHLVTLPIRFPLFVKPKSGEQKMIPSESRALFDSLGVKILDPNVNTQDCATNSLIISSRDSNVGLEAIQAGRPLLLFRLPDERGTSIQEIYEGLKVPVINAESSDLPQAFLQSDVDLRHLFKIEDFRSHVHKFVRDW